MFRIRTFVAFLMALIPAAFFSGGPLRNGRPSDMFDPRTEVEKFVNMVDYPKIRAYPKRWIGEFAPDQRKQILLELLHRLQNTREGRINNYGDMFVWSRVKAGKMEFPGHGLKLEQDILLENGRCAWAIEEIVGCHLPTFTVEVAHDPKKLEENVRQSFFKVIEAMDMPEKPKPAEPKPVESRIKPRYRDFSGQPPATNEKNPIKDEPAKTKSFPRPDVRQRKPFVNDESGATKAFPKRE
jgi:hypothetical protein